jgi:DNA gyrase subunit B
MFHKVERRLRDSRAVEVVGNIDFPIDHKADFQVEENLKPVFEALQRMGLNPEMRKDEEHSAWAAVYRDSTGAERSVGIQLAAQPEYRRFRALARTIARFNEPPFVVVKNEHRDSQPNWVELLEYVKTEGKKDASVKRYKGLGEMNAEQLADTTMNPEKRTLLQVRLEDAVKSEEIFSTLMGEDVEARRKFIEENALDVKNLDV